MPPSQANYNCRKGYNMRYVNACTFGYMCRQGFTQQEGWRESLRLMKETTGCDTVVIPVSAVQDHAYSTKVEYIHPKVMGMDDVRIVADEARKLGLQVMLKAIVNCMDGYWRAYIHFFDKDVPNEPNWTDWFQSYGDFVVALAETARDVNAEMLCIGCEMVGTDQRDKEWRQLIERVRKVYPGPITYNCDKYQEDNITWWDAVDVISSSGYYPIDKMEEHFQRIERVSEKFDRPFIFMESGCPSRKGSEYVPNDWRFKGELSLESQENWFKVVTDALIAHPKIRGAVWWAWSALNLYPIEKGVENDDYYMYGKPAARVLQEYSKAIAQRENG